MQIIDVNVPLDFAVHLFMVFAVGRVRRCIWSTCMHEGACDRRRYKLNRHVISKGCSKQESHGLWHRGSPMRMRMGEDDNSFFPSQQLELGTWKWVRRASAGILLDTGQILLSTNTTDQQRSHGRHGGSERKVNRMARGCIPCCHVPKPEVHTRVCRFRDEIGGGRITNNTHTIIIRRRDDVVDRNA